jgi:HAE1 family hydrophobic/amphiphilic exporter-1
MVDYINQVKAEGIDLLDSVIEGSLARMRPVLMTAMTTILGMVPLAVELGTGAETWSPLARAVIGGLFTTTILTLIVVPIMYIMLETMSEKFRNFIKGLSK